MPEAQCTLCGAAIWVVPAGAESTFPVCEDCGGNYPRLGGEDDE